MWRTPVLRIPSKHANTHRPDIKRMVFAAHPLNKSFDLELKEVETDKNECFKVNSIEEIDSN